MAIPTDNRQYLIWDPITESASMEIPNHDDLLSTGANTHGQIDTHIGDGSLHFGVGSIDHTAITNIGTNSHVAIDSHISDGNLHFTEGSIDHTAITNIGTNSHVAIDSHIADGALHFTEGSIDHGSIAGLGDDDHAQYLLIDGTRAMTGGLEFATGGDAVIYNSFLDGDIHFDVNNSAVGVNKRAMTIIAEDPFQGSSSIDLRPSDTVYLSNFVFMQDNLEIVNTESGFASAINFRLDNAVPTTGIRTFGVATQDPGFGSWSYTLGRGVGPNNMQFNGAFDTQFNLDLGQDFEFTGPLVLTDTLFPATANITLSDTATTGGGFAGGGIQSNGTITYDNGFFIWGLMVEQKTYRAAANPGFAAFTLFNALPLIENEGNFNLVSAILLNCGINHRRRTAGTSTVGQTFGLSFAPQTSATVSGAVMTRTNGLIAVSVAPTYGTAAGSTVNLGTIRGMQFNQPAQALFAPGSGTENMTAYLGIDFPDMTFGGVNRVIEVVRSTLNVGNNIRFLNHTGTAESQFGGHIHLNDGTFIKLGGTNAAFDAGIVWDTATSSLAITGGRTSILGTVKYAPITPAALAAGNNNDWSGLLTDTFTVATRHWARIAGNATTSVITGIDSAASEDGDMFKLTNVSANDIDIPHEDTASLAANRFITPDALSFVLRENESVQIVYDATSTRWRILGQTSNSTGGLISGEWRFDNATADANPGNGKVRYNNATPASVTEIYISDATRPGTDASNYLSAISSGDQIYVQNQKDSEQWIILDITSTTDNTTYWTLTGTVNSSGNLPQNNKDVIVSLRFT